MNHALPAATISGYEALIPTVNLPDPGDRHVVAAAATAGASVILTWNLRDFPAGVLETFGLRRETPDAFLDDLYETIPNLIVESLANARRNLSNSRVSAADFIDILKHQKLTRLARRMQDHTTDL